MLPALTAITFATGHNKKMISFVLLSTFGELWLRRSYIALGNEKKSKLFLFISLVFS